MFSSPASSLFAFTFTVGEGKPFDLIRTSDEGLVRFCVNEYTTDPEKITDNMMHVCNYDVNKLSDKFTPNDDPLQPQGHKWT